MASVAAALRPSSTSSSSLSPSSTSHARSRSGSTSSKRHSLLSWLKNPHINLSSKTIQNQPAASTLRSTPKTNTTSPSRSPSPAASTTSSHDETQLAIWCSQVCAIYPDADVTAVVADLRVTSSVEKTLNKILDGTTKVLKPSPASNRPTELASEPSTVDQHPPLPMPGRRGSDRSWASGLSCSPNATNLAAAAATRVVQVRRIDTRRRRSTRRRQGGTLSRGSTAEDVLTAEGKSSAAMGGGRVMKLRKYNKELLNRLNSISSIYSSRSVDSSDYIPDEEEDINERTELVVIINDREDAPSITLPDPSSTSPAQEGGDKSPTVSSSRGAGRSTLLATYVDLFTELNDLLPDTLQYPSNESQCALRRSPSLKEVNSDEGDDDHDDDDEEEVIEEYLVEHWVPYDVFDDYSGDELVVGSLDGKNTEALIVDCETAEDTDELEELIWGPQKSEEIARCGLEGEESLSQSRTLNRSTRGGDSESLRGRLATLKRGVKMVTLVRRVSNGRCASPALLGPSDNVSQRSLSPSPVRLPRRRFSPARPPSRASACLEVGIPGGDETTEPSRSDGSEPYAEASSMAGAPHGQPLAQESSDIGISSQEAPVTAPVLPVPENQEDDQAEQGPRCNTPDAFDGAGRMVVSKVRRTVTISRKGKPSRVKVDISVIGESGRPSLEQKIADVLGAHSDS